MSEGRRASYAVDNDEFRLESEDNIRIQRARVYKEIHHASPWMDAVYS